MIKGNDVDRRSQFSDFFSNTLPLGAYPFGFGGAAISGEAGGYGFGNVTTQEALSLLDHAYDKGVKLYDSAPIYGFGESEKRIGRAFKGRRDQVYLVSKSGVSWHNSKRVNMTNDPVTTQKMLEQSLKWFQSDYIDLYMIHWPDQRVDIRATMEVLARAKEKGMIKHIGLCNTTPDELELASEIDRVEVVQSEFSLLQDSASDQLFDYLLAQKIAFMSWGTFDKGILTGRVNKGRTFEASDCRSWAPWWKKSPKQWKYLALKELSVQLEKKNLSAVDLALAYNLSYPHVGCVLAGAKTQQQLDTILNSLDFLKRVDSVINDQEFLRQCREVVNTYRSGQSTKEEDESQD